MLLGMFGAASQQASAAQEMMLGLYDVEIRERAQRSWADGQAMFCAAVAELEGGVAAAKDAAAGSGSGRGEHLELGASLASMGECWYCIASAFMGSDGVLLGQSAQDAAERSLRLLKESLRSLESAQLESTLEYADAQKDYGKVLACFGEGEAPSPDDVLSAALRL